MDLRTDELSRDSFDLIHARPLLVHIPQRRQILDSAVRAGMAKDWARWHVGVMDGHRLSPAGCHP
jgi:hypothetical protein